MLEYIIIVVLVVAIGWLFFLGESKKKKHKEESQTKDGVISQLEKTVEKLLPANPCMTVSPKTDLHCMKPSSYVYAGLALCSDCAEKLIANGANPPPTKFEFK